VAAALLGFVELSFVADRVINTGAGLSLVIAAFSLEASAPPFEAGTG
jgi:hypothetical protein